MEKIKNFLDLDTYQKSISIINFSNEFFRKKKFEKFFNKLENIIKIEKNEILFFFKKIFLNNFDYNKNNINNKISHLNILKYFLIFNGLIFFKLFFKTRIYIPNNSKILIKNIDSNEQLYCYRKIINSYKKENTLIFKDTNFICDYRSINFSLIRNSVIPIKDIFKLFKFSFLIFYLSIKMKINLFYFVLKLVFENYFYNYVYNNSNIKAVLTHKYYSTSNIDNFYMNRNGVKSFVIQKNINTAHSNGFFLSADCFFALSKNCKIDNNLTFSKIKNQEYIGSFFMQNLRKDKISRGTELNYDILYIAGNGLKPKLHYDTYKSYAHDYLLQLDWLKKISNHFLNLKIGFKHHSNNNDNFEEDYLKGSKVEIIDKSLNSYHLVEQSNFICSWASTMILESIALKKFAYFLNPGSRNTQFLGGINNHEKISISRYDQFSEMYNIAKKNNFIRDELNEDYCVKKKNVCDEIINNINKYCDI